METGTTVNPRELETVLSRAVKVAPRKSTLGILTCVKLVAADGELVIEATDLELGYRSRLPVAGELAPTCVDARALRSAVKSHVRGGAVHLELVDGRLVVTGESGSASIETQGADDYPVLPAADIEAGETWRFARGDFAAALARTAFATATDQSRPVLEFVQAARQHDGRLRFCGADGFRMGYAFTPAPEGPEFPDGEGLGIHRRAAGLFADITRRVAGGSVTLGRYAPRAGGRPPVLAIHDSRETVLWNAPEGTFPDFTRVIPRDGANVIVAADVFGAAADRARSAHAPALVLDIGTCGVRATAKGDASTVACELEADVDATARGRHVALAPMYIRDACRANKGAALTLLVQEDYMRPVRYDVADAGGVIMPMNIPKAA